MYHLEPQNVDLQLPSLATAPPVSRHSAPQSEQMPEGIVLEVHRESQMALTLPELFNRLDSEQLWLCQNS